MTDPSLPPDGPERLDERELNALKLRECEARVRLLLDSTTEGIYGTDVNGNCTFCNAACLRLLGFGNPSEIVGRNVHALIHHSRPDGPPCPEQECRIVKALQQGKGAHSSKEVFWRRDGRSFATEYWSFPILREGDVTGSIVTFHDITEFRRAQEQMKEALAMKSDFVSFVTHQLRTPLTGIKWLLELAHAGELPAETQSYIQDARQSAERLIRLVNDLLDVTRLESGRLTLQPEEVSVRDLTDKVVDEMAPLVAEKGQRLSITGGQDLPRPFVDPKLLRQVIVNLLSNAVKYTPSGGEIAIRIWRESGSIRWAIRDSGIGIPKPSQRRLFEKFFRAENAATMDTEGTGLGLYLARLIVERFGGQIWCESEEGTGTTFLLNLPSHGTVR